MGMSELNITTVEHIRNSKNEDVDYRIDSPSVCVLKNTSAISISGWAFSDKKNIKEIHIMHGGRKIKSAKVNIPRKDVISKLLKFRAKSVCGFGVDVGIVGFPENIDIRIRVVFEDGSFALIARIIGTYTFSAYMAGSNKITPILLNSMGRMGTTMMMRLLKSHPDIVTTDSYPYEERPSQYWTHMFKVLSEPANYEESVTTDQFFSNNSMVGNNPFFTVNRETSSWYGDCYLDVVGGFVNNAINNYYNEQSSRQGRQGSKYFIEKMMSPNVPFWDTYNRVHDEVKNIFLVRDIRDVYCSVMDFNKKRGYMSFGLNESTTTDEYFVMLERQYSGLYTRWLSNKENSILVKYEDVLQDTHEELMKILNYLELDVTSDVIDAMVVDASKRNKNMKMHQTSASPIQSIGRWRDDLDPEIAKQANDKFKDALISFGYSLT